MRAVTQDNTVRTSKYDLFRLFSSNKSKLLLDTITALDAVIFKDGKPLSKKEVVRNIAHINGDNVKFAHQIFDELEIYGWLKEHQVGFQKYIDLNPVGLAIVNFVNTIQDDFSKQYKYELIQVVLYYKNTAQHTKKNPTIFKPRSNLLENSSSN